MVLEESFGLMENIKKEFLKIVYPIHLQTNSKKIYNRTSDWKHKNQIKDQFKIMHENIFIL